MELGALSSISAHVPQVATLRSAIAASKSLRTSSSRMAVSNFAMVSVCCALVVCGTVISKSLDAAELARVKTLARAPKCECEAAFAQSIQSRAEAQPREMHCARHVETPHTSPKNTRTKRPNKQGASRSSAAHQQPRATETQPTDANSKQSHSLAPKQTTHHTSTTSTPDAAPSPPPAPKPQPQATVLSDTRL